MAFLQATGLATYLVLVSLFFNFVTPNLDKNTTEFYAPIIMLLFFIISAVISASIVLGRAGILFWEKKYKESFSLLFWTVGWGILYFILFVLALYFS